MDYSRNQKNKSEILDIFQHLNSKLPDGCKVNEGHIQIEFPDRPSKTHGFRKKYQIPKKDTNGTMSKDDLLQICHEVQKLSKHLYRGWRFTRIIISKDDGLYDILGGLAKMTKGSKDSRRMDGQRDCPHEGYLPNGWKSKSGSHEEKGSKHSWRMDDQRDWSNEEYLPDGWKLKRGSHEEKMNTQKKIIHVSYTGTNQEYVKEDFGIETEDDLKKSITTVVYQEGNPDVDPYNAVVDTGCPKTVCGKPFMDAFLASKGKNTVIKRRYENQSFKFGDGKVYTSNMSHEIEVEIGELKTTLETSVVNVNIPLLLGMDYLKKWGVVIDTGNEEIFIRKGNESFKIDSKKSNHWKLPIQNGRTLHKQAHRLVLNVELCELNSRDLRKHIEKTHKNLAHKSEGHMLRLFQMAGKADTRTRKVIKDVCDSCNICKQFKKTRRRPSVVMSKANTSNEVVSLDLKEKRQLNRQILYCVDEFTGYIKAAVLRNKEPETILEALSRIWIREGPGHPSKGWFCDNGGEFRNSKMMEAATKLGLKIFLTAGNSPWSNGKNERNHYSCDITIDKLMSEDPNMTLESAVSHATYAHNVQINKKGFSPMQLTFGRQGVIPGITDGNPASMEPVIESDWFRQEISSRQRAEEIYRNADSNERLQKLMAQRTSGATDAVYLPGDDVLFKEKDKSRWTGPAKVTNVTGNKVRMIFGGFERTVPSIDVAHFKNERTIVESNETETNSVQEGQKNNIEADPGWQKDSDLPDGWMLKNNRNIRPKLNDRIEFIVNGFLMDGRVTRVGKKSGRDKYRCWIKEDESEAESSYDFNTEVEHWRKLAKEVSFKGPAKQSNSTAAKDQEQVGVLHLKNWHNLEEHRNYSQGMDTEKYTNDTFACEVPKSLHNNPMIIEAKKEEMRRWKEYDTVEQVVQTEDIQVISSRWVVTEKEEGSFKARLVVRGFEEEVYPQSDSPTANRDSFKIFLALAANEELEIKNMDVKSAFLQGTPLDRNVFMEPPVEFKKEGIVWKLKKTVYGLYDASRSWYFAVKDQLKKFGMKSVSGDDAFFTMNRNGKLYGMTVLHVDDFLVAGSPEFLSRLSTQLEKRFTFGRTEFTKFKFTGLNIEQTADGIYVDQVDYIRNIQPISSFRMDAHSESNLTKTEFKACRGLTGQLNWAAECTRPDLAFDVRYLSTRNKCATIADIANANKILKKAKYEDIRIKYSKLGAWNTLRLISYTDSSFKNGEDNVKSVGGRVTFLANSQGMVSPLNWKSKTIQQVCKSVKSAETRSLEQGLEDTIYTSRIISEIMTGKICSKIPVEHKIDSKTLHDSIISTKPIEEKTMRHLLAWIKQQKDELGNVSKIDWVPSHQMLADILTKKGVKADLLLAAVMRGKNSFLDS